MDDKQQQAINAVKIILSERFDSFVLAVRIAEANGEDRIVTDRYGSYSDSLGLARIMQIRLERLEKNPVP